jgi:peptidoglycan/LPS O-acetylase OafA/YrhL
VKYTPIPYVCTFLSGMVLAHIHKHLQLTDRARFTMAIGAILALGLMFYVVVPHLPYVMLHGGLLTPFAALLVLGCCGPHPITTLFSWKPIAQLGAATFCLYLLHFSTYNVLQDHHVPERLHIAAWDPWFSYAVCIAFALAAHHFVEKPARRALQRRFARKNSPGA